MNLQELPCIIYFSLSLKEVSYIKCTNFNLQEVSCIYGILAAILHTGNIEFKDKESEVYAGDAVDVANMELAETGNRIFSIKCLKSKRQNLGLQNFCNA